MYRTLKQGLKRILAKFNYEVHSTSPYKPSVPGIEHARIVPHATYAPWLSDGHFQAAYDAIRSHTLVDRYRCYELWQLVAEAAKLPAGDIIEIGVWRGGTGCLMAQKARQHGLNANVYLCDTFRGVVKAGLEDPPTAVANTPTHPNGWSWISFPRLT